MTSLHCKQLFFKSVSTSYAAGLPIKSIFSDESAKYDKLIKELSNDICQGSTLSVAMGKHGGFTSLEIGLVNIGQETGRLPQVLNHLADHLGTISAARKTTLTGLALPIINIHVAGFILPLPNFVIGNIGIYEYLFQAGTLIGGIWLLIAFFFIALPQLTASNLLPEQLMNLIPILGPYSKRSRLAQFLSTMSMALDAGIPMVQALKVSSESSPSVCLSKQMIVIKNKIEQSGNKLAGFAQSLGLNHAACSLIYNGEQTGKLPESLDQAAEGYYSKNKRTIKTLSIVAPIFVTGGIAAFIGMKIIEAYSNYFAEIDKVLN